MSPSLFLKPCTGVFSKTMAMPCSHRIQEAIQAVEPLPVGSSHSQWRILSLLKCLAVKAQVEVEAVAGAE